MQRVEDADRAHWESGEPRPFQPLAVEPADQPAPALGTQVERQVVAHRGHVRSVLLKFAVAKDPSHRTLAHHKKESRHCDSSMHTTRVCRLPGCLRCARHQETNRSRSMPARDTLERSARLMRQKLWQRDVLASSSSHGGVDGTAGVIDGKPAYWAHSPRPAGLLSRARGERPFINLTGRQ